ncbi:2-methylaconitate cis-trans isomerase PrpF family protein [Caproicibacter fermentans]|uniref:3-methylitaconate isomerase n=1 Tax=Caproicibacter fermentans TaxID=2576756 RepID=A0A7G8T7Q0_9FIRM|nr:PrpF domain-containing protein [Caproicibacter fermentans]QNK39641.1 3-methylitaconate isomerase [Caproicibacter fermentans]
MHSEMEMIRCAIVRGGTSKGIFLMSNELPADPTLRDKVILSIFGSPDVRQIDGLAGADVLTSKLAIIAPSSRDDADVDYTFGQVSMEKSFVDYGGNCGNISSAVGGFAIDMGMVKPVEPITTVRIHLTNTDRILTAEVPVKNGKAAVEGDYVIDGVPGSGAKITLDWSEVVGGVTRNLLPTKNVKDVIEANGKEYTVSVVDVGNVVVFVRADEMGLTGTETPAQIEADPDLMRLIEEIRGKVCQKIGLVENWQDAATHTPYQPFFAMVSAPGDYDCFNGGHVKMEEVDIVSRLLFMLHVHKAYPITGTVCTGAAARIPGSVVHDLISDVAKETVILNIGHPSGVIPVEAAGMTQNGETQITRLGVYRTARMIMDGWVYVRKSVLDTGH